jgi:hypothetical protein
VRPEQPLNAPSPIEVTDGGMVSEPVKPEQPSNAELLIVVIVGSRVISPEQQDEEGVVLFWQFEVIAWADEKKQRRRRIVVVVVRWAGLISWDFFFFFTAEMDYLSGG